MDFIKDKEQCINSVNELISSYGEPKRLAQSLDELVFDWLVFFGNQEETTGKWFSERISNIWAIRDFLTEIETINL
ncbi:MAG: hypothetical protein LBH30_03120 [Prevotellaceae bacterium]|jgi:hypothetical protein|nr:hypothetical protein [Prevotellaceae bacterium]